MAVAVPDASPNALSRKSAKTHDADPRHDRRNSPRHAASQTATLQTRSDFAIRWGSRERTHETRRWAKAPARDPRDSVGGEPQSLDPKGYPVWGAKREVCSGGHGARDTWWSILIFTRGALRNRDKLCGPHRPRGALKIG